MPSNRGWREIQLHNMIHALENGAIKWWTDPRNKRPCLKARSGIVYDFVSGRGCHIRKRWDNVFN